MGNPVFEDVSPIGLLEMVVFHCYVSLPEGKNGCLDWLLLSHLMHLRLKG